MQIQHVSVWRMKKKTPNPEKKTYFKEMMFLFESNGKKYAMFKF